MSIVPTSRGEKGVHCKIMRNFTAKIFRSGWDMESYCSIRTSGKSDRKPSLDNLNNAVKCNKPKVE
jgi:hypothetical protein